VREAVLSPEHLTGWRSLQAMVAAQAGTGDDRRH